MRRIMPRRCRTLVVLIAAITAFSVPETAAAADAEDDVNPLGRGAAVVAKGGTLYNNTCTICHGPDGAAGGRPGQRGNERNNRTIDDSKP